MRIGLPSIQARMFSTDSPYTVPVAELERVRDWSVPAADKAAVLGGNLVRLLAARATP